MDGRLEQRQFARRAVETGAEVVVIEHAHCLQPHEDWRDGHIFYGLGNFIFGNILGEKWPALAYCTAMAYIEVNRGRVERVHFNYLCRRNSILDWDDRKSRFCSHKRLNFCIHFSDRVYRVLYGWEKYFLLEIIAYFQFIKKSGGIIPSLFRIRKRHFSKILRAATSPFRRTG